MLITVSRRFGAGGSEVAGRVAESLGWRVVDNAFVDQVAERAGLPPEEVARREERTPTFLDRLSRTTALAFPEIFATPVTSVEGFEEEKLVKITRNLVAELASEGRIVLVGRAAAAMLADNPEAIHVLLVGTRDDRIRFTMDRLNLDAAAAAQAVDDVDRNRERYHREYYGREWLDAANYDMTLNTSRLGFRGAAELIEARARSLGW
ncbi:MAG: cytidylate kinase-like family protein [Deltaproteobacteria bacterium]|jgi:cytidylate kinase|nr:cytidylate kinase-like family protein [Deltaproteobacteria bacterium]MBW2413290.1 cytidylate kinase-like family protein [Deltaproteobacteria bacterium]